MYRSAVKAALLTTLMAAFAAPIAAAASSHGQSPGDRVDVVGPFAWHGDARATDDGKMSLDEAVRKVRRRYGDVTILKARTKGRNGKRVHRIKFLTESGRVRTVRVDADNGKFL